MTGSEPVTVNVKQPKPMRMPPLLACLVVAATIVTCVVTSFALRPEKLRLCGHPHEPSWMRLSPFRATHCCTSGRTVGELSSIYYAQRVYQMSHGNYAGTFEQLTNEYRRRPGDYYLHLLGGDDWSVMVTQQDALAGSYLVTSDGKLHFNKGAVVTTNDPVLTDLSKE